MSRVEQNRRTDGSVAIYALCEPHGEVRYVGKTECYLHVRHKAHIRNAKKGLNWPVCSWLRKSIAAGSPLTIKLIEYVPSGADWAEREKFWIAEHKPAGRLLNLTDGGDGIAGYVHLPDARKKMGDARRGGAHFDCEVCGTKFWRKPYAIKHGECRFCSRACSNARHRGWRLPL